jgi:hypothetical protein
LYYLLTLLIYLFSGSSPVVLDRQIITNQWGDAKTTKLNAKHIEIFRGYPGAAYSHHPQIVSFQGILYATWSNGIVGEDNPGQKMLMATSTDNGQTWSQAMVLACPNPGQEAYEIITSEGIRVIQDRLVAFYGVYEYTEQVPLSGNPPERPHQGKAQIPKGQTWHQYTRTEIRISDDKGTSWSTSKVIIKNFMPNLSPQQIRNGRWIIPGNISFPYTDDPDGLDGWHRVGLPRLPAGYVDDPEGFHKVCRARGDSIKYCEGDFFQTTDGVIHMMLRTSTYRLAVTQSRDNGKTWSEPRLTDYTDCRSRFDFGQLPDGRYYGLSCPKPKSARTPLILAVSKDGVVFDRHFILGDKPASKPRMPGSHKGGRYGYPYMHIMDDQAFVIYSVNKEDVWMCRFDLNELDEKSNMN